jgi:hypothetical protein
MIMKPGFVRRAASGGLLGSHAGALETEYDTAVIQQQGDSR